MGKDMCTRGRTFANAPECPRMPPNALRNRPRMPANALHEEAHTQLHETALDLYCGPQATHRHSDRAESGTQDLTF